MLVVVKIALHDLWRNLCLFFEPSLSTGRSGVWHEVISRTLEHLIVQPQVGAADPLAMSNKCVKILNLGCLYLPDFSQVFNLSMMPAHIVLEKLKKSNI